MFFLYCSALVDVHLYQIIQAERQQQRHGHREARGRHRFLLGRDRKGGGDYLGEAPGGEIKKKERKGRQAPVFGISRRDVLMYVSPGSV